MKKVLFKIGIAVSAVVLFNSCSVEKRLYRNGMNIEWHSGLKKSKGNVETQEVISQETKNSNDFSSPKVNNTLVTNDVATNDNGYFENNQEVKETSENNLESNVLVSNSNTQASVGSTIEQNDDIKNNSTFRKPVFSKQKAKIKSKVTGSMSDDDLIGLILCLVGLAPFGVMVAKGKRSTSFKTNLMLWLGGFACIILSVILAFSGSLLGAVFSILGSLLFLASFIHGLISILR
jgi:hypothetical protein